MGVIVGWQPKGVGDVNVVARAVDVGGAHPLDNVRTQTHSILVPGVPGVVAPV
jgi:hypothetical protein